MELPTMSGSFPFVGLVTIFLAIQVLVCTCSSNYKNSPECNKPFNCETIQYISYPFRQRGTPEYCGQPGFELFCRNGLPFISIDSESYQVLVYNTTLKVLTVAQTIGVLNGLCPNTLVNTSLNLSPFHLNWNTKNLSLYYNCPANANQYEGLSNHQFNCTSYYSNSVGYFVVTSSFSKLSVAAKDALRSCHDYVLLPAFGAILQVLERRPSPENLMVTLLNGFQVQWSENVSSLPDNQKTNMNYNIDVNVSQTSEIYFPSWIYKHLDHTMNLNPDEIMVEEEDVITKKLTVVSLWCIQSVPTVRPSMTKVVEMLQGDIQSLEIPPNPCV